MLKDQIVVGKAYVNARTHVVREVVEEVDERRVKFQAFELGSGRLLPSRHRVVEKRDMAAWAEREASPRETALIHPYYEEAAGLDSPARPADRNIQLEAVRAALEAVRGPHLVP